MNSFLHENQQLTNSRLRFREGPGLQQATVLYMRQ